MKVDEGTVAAAVPVAGAGARAPFLTTKHFLMK